MMFRASVIALIASMVSATSFIPGEISADSKMGSRLLKSATVVEPARHLEQNNQDKDVTFIAGYSLKYLGCSSVVQLAVEGGGGDEGMLYNQHLVKFALCPGNDGCGNCNNGGEYVVNMMEFVDAYTEAKLDEQEYQCEMVRENCYCENANDDDACEYQCYMDKGMDYCIEYEGQEEFEIQRYLECAELEQQNDNNNGYNGYNGYNNNQNNNNQNYNNNANYWQEYFVGPTCSSSDGKSIHLHVYSDEACTQKADNEIWAQFNYGQALPFSSESIVKHGDCVSCQEVDRDANNGYGYYNGNNNNGNYNYNQNWEPSELCQVAYESAARCERNMDIYYPDTSGCDYINEILPRLENASRSSKAFGGGGSSGGGKAAKVFAWLFGITTVMFGAYAYFLYRKIKRGSVNLSSQGASLA